MTVEQAKKLYGILEKDEYHGAGYVPCYDCPCNTTGEHCSTHCNGYDDAYTSIVDYFTIHPELDPIRNESTEVTEVKDNVNHPSHYTQGGIECIDAMIAAFGKERTAEYCVQNAFKYVWRSRHKNGQEDIEKAIWYLNKAIELGVDA